MTIDEHEVCKLVGNNNNLNKVISINSKTKEKLIKSIDNAINELDEIIKSSNIEIKNTNKMLYYSLLMLVDELDYILSYITKIENQIDIAVFDVAKKLNDGIINLIGHRKEIMFKIVDIACKLHDYILKQKKLLSDENDEAFFKSNSDFWAELNTTSCSLNES